MECPNCGAPEELLDFWITGEPAGDCVWQWNCFECEHEWQASQSDMEKILTKEKEEKNNGL